MKRGASFAAVLILGLLFSACGNDEPTAGTDAGANESPATEDGTVEITAVEYAFNLPETLPAGETTFTLTNSGDEKHFIEMIPLSEDAPSVEELLEMSEKKSEKFFAGPPISIRTVKPGETSDPVEANLTPGRYGYVCFIEDKDGTPHAFLGMAGDFTVE